MILIEPPKEMAMSSERRQVQTSVIGKTGAKPMPEDNFHKIDAPKFSDDLIVGADAFASWLFGTSETRRVYHLIETSRLPTFRLGSKVAAQKSVLRATFWAQQKRAFSNDDIEALIRLRLLLLKTVEVIRTAEEDATVGNSPDRAALSLCAAEVSNAIERLTNDR
jgi:hypothetical protein